VFTLQSGYSITRRCALSRHLWQKKDIDAPPHFDYCICSEFPLKTAFGSLAEH
jgi:hypothetical protein